MTFYTNKWLILENDQEDIRLFRKINKEITMERIVGAVEKNEKEYLCKDVFSEFDIEIDNKGDIYLLYQNDEMNLILKILKGEKIETIKLTDNPIGEIVYLNMAMIDEKINILYAITTIEKDNYKIYHHYYYRNKWSTFIVDEINEERILNPIKIIKEDKNMVLLYIKGKDIFIKTFSFKDLKWSENIKITNTQNEKLFLDMIKVDDIFHMIYCEFIDDSLVVKYKQFNFKNISYSIIQENILSKKGSPSYPTLISYKDEIWATWIELGKVYSRALNKDAEDWGALYLWEESINKDIIRYKYIEKNKSEDILLDYSFGKVYPEVQFLGFGPTSKARKIQDIKV